MSNLVAGFFLPDWTASHPVQALVNMPHVQHLVVNEFQTTIQQHFPLASVQPAIEFCQKNPTAGKVLFLPDPG